MGTAIARTLLAADYSVTVWNRDPAKVSPLVDEGAIASETLSDAIKANPASIICIKTHETTRAILAPLQAELAGKTIIDLSSGGAGEAEALVEMLRQNDATWQLGMINAYPSGIGEPETAILYGGPRTVWDVWGETLRILGGRSEHVGTAPSAVPALFAALFTARQGFIFGLIYGGAVAKRAGLDLEALAKLVPITHAMAGTYGEMFARTVPNSEYDNAEATMDVYRLALNDVLATFEETNTRDDLPRLLRDLTAEAVAEGHDLKQLTYLVEHLANPNTPR